MSQKCHKPTLDMLVTLPIPPFACETFASPHHCSRRLYGIDARAPTAHEVKAADQRDQNACQGFLDSQNPKPSFESDALRVASRLIRLFRVRPNPHLRWCRVRTRRFCEGRDRPRPSNDCHGPAWRPDDTQSGGGNPGPSGLADKCLADVGWAGFESPAATVMADVGVRLVGHIAGGRHSD